jgi:histidyl-tRNA synthetase
MTDTPRAPKGMHDLFEEDLVTWRHLEHLARDTFLAYGYGEIRTPIVEELDLFVRGVGEATDMVGKEMFLVEDRHSNAGGASKTPTKLALRPESTAGTVRALIEHGKAIADTYTKVFYTGPQFRNERPQAGRYRQFAQLGCECVGWAEAAADVEVIALVHTLLARLGIKDVTLLLSSLGDSGEDRKKYNAALRAYLEQHREKLSEDSKRRLEQNPLRILDSKDEGDQKLIVDAPKPLDFLSDAARAHFDEVKAGLDALGIAYTIEPKLVRGIDYYTRTVFEFVGKSGEGVGAQSTVAAGGRYDGLIKELGGEKQKPTPAVGFAAGVDRLVLVMKATGLAKTAEAPDLVLVGADAAGHGLARKLGFELRTQGVRVGVDLKARGVGAQMKGANRSGARFTLTLGSREIEARTGELKRMATGAVTPVSLDAASIMAVLRSE